MKKRNSLLALIFSSALLFACNQKATSNNEAVHFQPLVNGQTSGYSLDKEQVFFIPTQEKWNEFLKIHGQNEAMPNIDFNDNAVIAIVDKTHSSGGYNLNISEIMKTDKGTEVFITRDIPGTNCMTTMMMTQPYIIVTVPKAKTGEPVVIHMADNAVNC